MLALTKVEGAEFNAFTGEIKGLEMYLLRTIGL